MDDLKQSVQGAVYEQKDPLLIYKFESFELFKGLVSKVNKEIISFLLKADIPQQDPEQVREARSVRRQQQNVQTQKEDAGSALQGGQAPRQAAPAVQAPVKSSKEFGRNDRVTVQYNDGSIKKDVKFKVVEQDLASNRCVILSQN